MGFPTCIDDICVLGMKVIIIDQTPNVQTYGRKSRGTLCSLPRKLTKATPGGVKVNLAVKIIFSYYYFQHNLFICIVLHSYFRLQQVDVSHT